MAVLPREKGGTVECLLYEQYVFDAVFSILPKCYGHYFFSISIATEVNRSLRITIFLPSQNSCEVRFCSKKIRVGYYVPLEEKLINSYQMVVNIAISNIC